MARRSFIPLVPSTGINADSSVAQLEQDVLAMDSRVGELAEDVGTIEQWDAGDIPYDSTETYSANSVGETLTNVKSQIDVLDYFDTVDTHDVNDWAQGYWQTDNGTSKYVANWTRSNNILDESVVSISTASPYRLLLVAYNENEYVGTWFGSEFSKTYDSSFLCYFIDLTWFRKQYPTYTFRLNLAKTSGNFTVQDAAENVTIKKSVLKIENRSIQVLFGDIAKKNIWQNGSIISDGSVSADYTTIQKRVCTIPFLKIGFPITIVPKSGYTFSVTTYSSSGTKEAQFSAWSSTPYTLKDVNKLYKITIKKSDNDVINPAGISNYIEAYILRSTPFDRLLSEFANVKAINHRGYNAIAPENTLPAFEMSADFGFKYVETDVRFTSDGVPVLMHDESINRTARNSDGTSLSSTVNIADITYAEALDYDYGVWKNAAYAGTKIPTFAEFMHCCKARNLHAWVELKGTYTQEEVQLVISIIKQYGMEEHVSFISFEDANLALVAAEWETVELGLNGDVEDALALKTGKNRVFMIYAYNADFSAAITAGLQVCVYTVDTEANLANITSNGYDSVLTNALFQSQVCDVVRNKYDS